MKQEYITKEAAIEAFRKALDGGYVIQNAEQAERVIRDIPATKFWMKAMSFIKKILGVHSPSEEWWRVYEKTE